MPNEATIHSSLTIFKDSLNYTSRPTIFQADITGTKGPTPGAMTVDTIGGTIVNLAQITTPGFCRIANLEPTTSTNYLIYGVWNGATFYPLGEALPGETYILRLSRNLLDGANELRLVAVGAQLNALVEVFEA